MLADPQTVTINAVAKTLNRTSTEGTRSIYQTDDGEFRFTVSHQETSKKRIRRMVRVDQTVVAADPLTAENAYQSAGVYIVIDEPEFGFTDAQLGYIAAGLTAWATPTNVGKICASQH